LRWKFKEPKGSLYYCADTFWLTSDECRISFKEYVVAGKSVELLAESKDINVEWLDVVNY